MTTTATADAEKRRIAIVGFSASSLDEVPISDASWEIWGLNELWSQLKRWDVWFDLHSWAYISESRPGHVSWLKNQPPEKPIFMQETHTIIPSSRPFPYNELIREFGPYFTSSIAWLLAFAIMQEPFQIGIWGVDMLHESEYQYQRPCCDYYIGLARGRGISVYLPDCSALAKAPLMYGYDEMDRSIIRPRFGEQRFKKRRGQLIEGKDHALRAIYNIDGSLETIKQFGIADDLMTRIEQKAKEQKINAKTPPLTLVKAELEAYRAELFAQVEKKRESALQTLYSIDGAIQELGYWFDIVKHLRRAGV